MPKSLVKLLSNRLPYTLGFTGFLIMGTFVLNDYFWTLRSTSISTENVRHALARTIATPVENQDLIMVRNIMGGFYAANPGSVLCLRFASGEVIQYANSRSCEWKNSQTFYTDLRNERYDLVVESSGLDLHYFTILVVFIILALLVSVYYFASYFTKLICSDIKQLGLGRDPKYFLEFRDLNREIIEQKKALIEAKKLEGIANTTQMLAHDVRKPFTMLQGVMSMIGRAGNLSEVKSITRESLPEIERGINSVNGMIQDVMEVGSSGKLSQEEANPETIIETTVTDSFRYLENAEIEFSYDLQHKNKVNIDILKTSRVFANIIGNGAQAMDYMGRMWFKTTPAKDGLIQFTIGNSNSYIPPEKIEKLFEAFYTSGKKDGTGLGLAIVKKVVEGHGGEIWCTSSETEGTEFHFTLPSLEVSSDYEGDLPASAEAIRSGASMDSETPASSDTRDANEWLFEQEIIRTKAGSDKPISILLVDDEKLYITVLKNQLTCNEELAKHISFGEASSGEDALMLAAQRDFDMVILDVDMGKCSLNGFDTAYKLRRLGVKATICIHSNRGGSEYYKKAMDSGADMFIGKTMPREHFLRMVYGVIGDPHKLLNSSIVGLPDAEDAEQPQEGRKLILVEDNKIIRGAWKSICGSERLSSFESPESFLEAIVSDPKSIESVEAIIIDNNFDGLSDMTGFELAKSLREKNITAKLAISTGEDFTAADIEGVFDLVIPKNPSDGIRAIDEFLQGVEVATPPAEDKSKIDKKREHDIQNCYTCLRILAGDLEDGKFSDETYASIKEYALKLDELTGTQAGTRVIQVAKESPETLSLVVVTLSQEDIKELASSRRLKRKDQ